MHRSDNTCVVDEKSATNPNKLAVVSSVRGRVFYASCPSLPLMVIMGVAVECRILWMHACMLGNLDNVCENVRARSMVTHH
jgi:hypothetical protein